MKYPVLMAMYNQTPQQLNLTKEALDSVLRQDVGELEVCLVDNGSDGETKEWASRMEKQTPCLHVETYPHNVSPVIVANHYLSRAFRDFDYLLSVPNDVVLPRNFYREVLRWPRGLVCASQTAERDFPMIEESHAVSEMTPMAVALVRKWFHDALVAKDGYFLDPAFAFYGSDCDMALRMAACGIRGIQLDIQYFHYGSASWRLSTPEVAKQITGQADVDRAYFQHKYGFAVDSPLYGETAGNINFRG